MDASDHDKVEKVVVNCRPRKAKCPHCGKLAKRVKCLTRNVISMAYKRIRIIEVRYGEYETSCQCCATFRTNPDEIVPPKSKYDNRIRDAVVKHLIEDRLSVTSLIHRFERDFFIKLSPGFIYDCLREACQKLDLAECRRLSLQHY
ncbi:MAG: transposase family protein [Planctomycetaceae bacterium]|nr:transposase family protein [Planctomycetaceae bacterium]